jgi:serine/threonine protein kinase
MVGSKATIRRKEKRRRAQAKAKLARKLAGELKSDPPPRSSRRRKRRPTTTSTKVIPNNLVDNVVVHGDKEGGYGVFSTASLQCTVNGSVTTFQTVALKSAKDKSTLPDLEHEITVYRKLRGLRFLPSFYGLLYNHPQLPTSDVTIVLEEGQVPLAKLWKGISSSCTINTPDCMNRPGTAGALLRRIMVSLLFALKTAHRREVCHGDLKISNLVCRVVPGAARPVVSYDALEVLLIDWGMNLHGSWRTGTRPCSMATWFRTFPGRQTVAVEQKRAADFFQTIMVAVTLMLKGRTSPNFKAQSVSEGAQYLGGRWLGTQVKLKARDPVTDNGNHMQGWLYFLMFHKEAQCVSSFHSTFCTHLKPYKMHYHSELSDLDLELTRLFMFGA